MAEAELHLNLCPQSTSHLVDAVANIKENFQTVDEIICSGLKNLCTSGDNGNVDVTDHLHDCQHEHHDEEGVIASAGLTEQETQKDSDGDGQAQRQQQHHCCCMCRLRLSSPKSQIPKSPSNLTSDKKTSKKRPGKPRLNRTASLRRESAAERRASQDNNQVKTK